MEQISINMSLEDEVFSWERPYRVLIVSKNQHMLRALQEDFAGIQGYEVIIQSHRARILSILGEKKIDVLVVEFSTPDEWIMELMRKAKGVNPLLKIVTLPNREMNNSEKHLVNDQLVSGVHVLHTPFTIKDLQTKLNGLLCS